MAYTGKIKIYLWLWYHLFHIWWKIKYDTFDILIKIMDFVHQIIFIHSVIVQFLQQNLFRLLPIVNLSKLQFYGRNGPDLRLNWISIICNDFTVVSVLQPRHSK
jgi:hypothetical protein